MDMAAINAMLQTPNIQMDGMQGVTQKSPAAPNGRMPLPTLYLMY